MSAEQAAEYAGRTPNAGGNRALRAAVGALATGLAWGGVLFLYEGLGALPQRQAPQWWHPGGFMHTWGSLTSFEEYPMLGALALCLPIAILAGLSIVFSRSAISRWLALSAVVCAALFGFYGLSGSGAWEFFHWRGTLVLVAIALSVGAALASPWLAESWLDQSPAVRTLLYAPVWIVVVGALRHATGTDEHLAFNISPWAALPIYGFEVGAYVVIGVVLGWATAALGASLWGRSRLAALLMLGAALALPTLWLLGKFGGQIEASTLGMSAMFALLVAPAAVSLRRDSSGSALRRRAFVAFLGAALAYLPIFSGRALATGDYTATRFVRAQAVIDALGRYFQKREEYPEKLDQLVQLGYLESLPRPRIGFEWLYDLGWLKSPAFDYQNLGSSYVLEFEGTEWVQCAYNPPWEDDEEYAEDEAEQAADGVATEDDESLDEAWSCPESRPELW